MKSAVHLSPILLWSGWDFPLTWLWRVAGLWTGGSQESNWHRIPDFPISCLLLRCSANLVTLFITTSPTLTRTHTHSSCGKHSRLTAINTQPANNHPPPPSSLYVCWYYCGSMPFRKGFTRFVGFMWLFCVSVVHSLNHTCLLCLSWQHRGTLYTSYSAFIIQYILRQKVSWATNVHHFRY